MSFYDKYFIKKTIPAFIISMKHSDELYKKLVKEHINPVFIDFKEINYLQILEKIALGKDSYNVILEDNVILVNNFYNKFNILMKQVPKDFDILYLEDQNNSFILGKFQKIKSSVDLNQSFVLSKKGAKKLIKSIKNDFFGNIIINSDEIIAYTSYKKLFTNKKLKDNLLNNHPIILKKLLSLIKLDESNINLGYLMTQQIYKFKDFTLTNFSIVFFLFGIFLGNNKDYSLSEANLFFFLLSIPDLTKQPNISIGIHYLLFIISFLIFRNYDFIKKIENIKS
jgi:hypothetical protein